MIVQAAIHECMFDQQNNQPYCPDLAPSNYYLLKNLEFDLQGTRFPSYGVLRAVTKACFEDQIEDFCFKDLHSLN